MSEKKTIRAGAVCLLVSLLAALFFTACSSKATNAADKIELGQKYLTELNYTEAVASFTEAIKLDPDNIQAYMGRAEAYMALGEYDKALADYRFISGMTEDMPYTRALSYIGQAEVYEKMEQPARAVSDYGLAKALLNASDAAKVRKRFRGGCQRKAGAGAVRPCGSLRDFEKLQYRLGRLQRPAGVGREHRRQTGRGAFSAG